MIVTDAEKQHALDWFLKQTIYPNGDMTNPMSVMKRIEGDINSKVNLTTVGIAKYLASYHKEMTPEKPVAEGRKFRSIHADTQA